MNASRRVLTLVSIVRDEDGTETVASFVKILDTYADGSSSVHHLDNGVDGGVVHYDEDDNGEYADYLLSCGWVEVTPHTAS